MRLIGYRGEGNLFFLPVFIRTSRFPNQLFKLKFYVDTGASITAISDTDALANGIPYHDLQMDSMKPTGIVGSINTRILPDCEVIFWLDEAIMYSRKWRILRIMDRGDPINAKADSRISLLGVDFLQNFRISFQGHRVILEKEFTPSQIPSLPKVKRFKANLPT